MKCNICNNHSKFFLKNKALNKYDAELFQCESCGFIQTKNPHWLNEAYKSAISQTDTGLVARNINLSNLTEKIIKQNFDYSKRFIDYGGGYGLFVRLMRDKGFNFYRQDSYCENLFAQHFDTNGLKNNDEKFELLTTFEVFEHLENPVEEIEKMLKLSDSILFSTELQPQNIKNQQDWWYFSPESGQHISFYTKKTLSKIAKRFNLNLYTNNQTLHLLTNKTIGTPLFENSKKKFIYRIRRKLAKLISPENSMNKSIILKSLTQKDSDFIKSLSKNKKC